MNFEEDYKDLILDILKNGIVKKGRNGDTLSVFGKTLTINLENGYFPLLTGRRVFYKGVFGELAALLRQPKHIDDFRSQGCNYWDLWAAEDGSINVDYGNKWLDWNGVNQLEQLIYKLKNNPNDRRLIINSWDPANIDNLSLPCCHYAYQWYVRNGYLDILWHQRSVDTMIGLPSDIIFAATWNIMIANEVGLKPGKITMTLGDTHIYSEHIDKIPVYLDGTIEAIKPTWNVTVAPGTPTVEFTKDSIIINDYRPDSSIDFMLKG